MARKMPKVTLDWAIVGVAGHGPFLRMTDCSLIANASMGSRFVHKDLNYGWEDRSYQEGRVWEGPWFFDDVESVLADAQFIASLLGAALVEHGTRKTRPSSDFA